MARSILTLGVVLLLSSEIYSGTLRVPSAHKTIQAAIDAATAGDQVLVSAGLYRERIRLKAGVLLRSAGDDTKGKLGLKRAEETTIDAGGEKAADGPGVRMAEGATLDGFTVTGSGHYDDAKWNKHHATQGSQQSHEHIGGFGTPGVGADGVTCQIINNIVHHNGDTGIAIRGSGEKKVTPLVKGNVSYRNMGGGIGIMNKASGLVTGNTCFENFYAGIGHSGASPLVEDNECYQNIRAGIGISEGASPTVRRNRCYKNRRAGIGIRTGLDTAPVVIDNDCYENDMAGIGSAEESAPTIQNNRCLRNKLAGIGARDDAQPVIIGNECRENKAAGIGLAACKHGKALVSGNLLIDNALVAVGVQAGWQVSFVGNTLSRKGGLPPMIMVFENAHCSMERNSITGNGVAGVRVAGSVTLSGDTFDGQTVRKGGPPHFGVWALPGSTVTIHNCRFSSWRHALHASGATVVATNNSAENIPAVAFVVQKPAAPAHLVNNIAHTDNPKFKVVEVEGEGGAVQNNTVKPGK